MKKMLICFGIGIILLNVFIISAGISGCRPDKNICSNACSNVFINTPIGFTFDKSNSDCNSFGGCWVQDFSGHEPVYTINNDSYCDTLFSDGKNGDCASYYAPNFYADYYCPSAVRLGRTVTTSDCLCTECNGGACDLNFEDIFNLNNPYFNVCWIKTNNVLFIPNGCVYQIDLEELFKLI